MAYTEGCVSLPGRHRQDGISHRKLGKYVETVNRGIDMNEQNLRPGEYKLSQADRYDMLLARVYAPYMQRIKLGTK